MLQVIKAKPNPAGKDRLSRSIFLQTRLGAEWIDIKNMSASNYQLKNIQIYHVAYKNNKAEWESLKIFYSSILNVTLPANSIMRIHSGSGPVNILNTEDKLGANLHYFTGKNYVWNNDKIDRPMIYDSKNDKIIDQTYYDAPVADGKILVRVNDKLI